MDRAGCRARDSVENGRVLEQTPVYHFSFWRRTPTWSLVLWLVLTVWTLLLTRSVYIRPYLLVLVAAEVVIVVTTLMLKPPKRAVQILTGNLPLVGWFSVLMIGAIHSGRTGVVILEGSVAGCIGLFTLICLKIGRAHV